MKIYGFNVVNSEGWPMGNESRTKIFLNRNNCIRFAYKEYERLHEANLCDLGSEYKIKESYLNFMLNLMTESQIAGVLQFSDFHIQFEYFELEPMDV